MGINDGEVPETLVSFLKYAGEGIIPGGINNPDEFVVRLHQTVEKIKKDREMGRRYMLLEELMKDEYNAGKEDGKAEGIKLGSTFFSNSIIEILNDISPISDNFKKRISSIENLETLALLVKKAARVQSVEEFEIELRKFSV